ncbi:MAG: OadG family protein [Desulfobacterales bacterium]
MFGIDNITNNNGWAMAAVGATTVFLGLVVLSFVISQIHKILEFWENRGKNRNENLKMARKEDSPKDEAPAHQELRLPTAAELCSIYRPLVEQLKEPFQLIQLFEKTKEMDLPHPHLSIKCLQEADVLVAQGDGTFIWDKQKAN